MEEAQQHRAPKDYGFAEFNQSQTNTSKLDEIDDFKNLEYKVKEQNKQF